ncbi:MAG: carboxypeptidase regulatory-like domain-containing protein [Myxococcales bacterium]|nr:carboxypeptidase regulatory-like domain-containing protein [Myxococcales bacterium]
MRVRLLLALAGSCSGRATALAPSKPALPLSCERAPMPEPTANVVWGVITDEHGAPTAGATVEVTTPGTPLSPRQVWDRTTTAADGRYLLYLLPGTYTLHFSDGTSMELVERSPHSIHTIERLDVRLDGTPQEHWVDPARPTCHDSSRT